MRLIDADYITEGRVSNDPVVIAAKCAPTIDAIPVWELFGLIDAFVTTGDENMQEYALLLTNIIETWRKEQEAR